MLAPSLTLETEAAKRLLEACAETIGDDEELALATVEGETNLIEAMTHAIGRVIELRTEIAALAERATLISHRKKRREDALARVQLQILEASAIAGVKKIPHPEATVSIAPGRPKVIILDETELPEKFIRYSASPNKEAIAEALRADEPVPGAVMSNPEPTLRIKHG